MSKRPEPDGFYSNTESDVSYLHQQRVTESQSALQVLPEGIVQKAGAGDLLVFKFVQDELRGLT